MEARSIGRTSPDGVGRNLHEEPSVFNFHHREMPNVKLRAGMTLAIEPIGRF